MPFSAPDLDMEAVIRWSPRSTSDSQRFLVLNLAGRNAKLCEVESSAKRVVQYKQLAQHTKLPAFRAFDWSPVDEGLVAVGLPSGEASVLRIDDNSNDTWSFPVKHQRGCNSVAFSTKGLLAAGLDKVRNDFCLNIWDARQRLASAPSPKITSPASPRNQPGPTPLRQLSSSEGITSVKFFYDQPDTLVAGVKGQYLRIYDLRDPATTAALQFPTRYVHYLAIDPLDENHFASAGSGGDATICIWDRRAAPRLTAASLSSGYTVTDGLSVELKNVIDTRQNSSIWSVRYSRSKRGALGILSTSGQVRVYETVIDSVAPATVPPSPETTSREQDGPELLRTKHVRELETPFFDKERSQEDNYRIVSFDWVNFSDATDGHRFITLGADRAVHFYNLPGPSPSVSLLPRGSIAIGKGQSTVNVLANENHPTGKLAPGVAFLHPPTAQGPIAETMALLRAKGAIGEGRKPLATSVDAAPVYQLDKEDLLRLRTVLRRRCEEGYLFDARLNQTIVADDVSLQNFWAWIEAAENLSMKQGMVFYGLDLSFLGVHRIWNANLGPNAQARLDNKSSRVAVLFPKALKACNEHYEREHFTSVSTDYPDRRQLCLAICGRDMSSERVKGAVDKLVIEGRHTEAAALALFQGQPRHAIAALDKGADSHKLLTMAIAVFNHGASDSRNGDKEWTKLCKDIAASLDDPYSRAILALVGEGRWESVVEEKSLPLGDRLAVALRYFSDEKLTAFVNKMTRDVVSAGNLEGIVLTGLTEDGNDLLHEYALRCCDPQTAALSMAYANPRYVNDIRFEHWREQYRSMMGAWKLHIQRAKFDVEWMKKSRTRDGELLVQPLPRQVTLRCNYCSRSLASNVSVSGSNDTLKAEGNPLHRGGKSSGTVCPSCKRHLPRCGVCDTHLGVPDAMTPGGAAAAEVRDPLRNFTNFCTICDHGFHALHARQWFARHKMCPVPDCQCLCARLERVGV